MCIRDRVCSMVPMAEEYFKTAGISGEKIIRILNAIDNLLTNWDDLNGVVMFNARGWRVCDITQKVFSIISKHPEVNFASFDLSTRFRSDLGIDSLAIAEIAIDMEDEFAISFQNVSVADLNTVGDIVNQVKELTSS